MDSSPLTRRQLLEAVPEGLLTTREALKAEGYSRHKLDNLLKSEQLQSIAPGVYTRLATKLTWEGVVCSLQRLKSDLVIGGLTALELQGSAHNLRLAKRKTIHLYGRDSLPSWVNGLLPGVTFARRNSQALAGRFLVNHEFDTRKKEFYDRDPLRGFTETLTWREGVWPLTASSVERAFLEVLLDVPESVSFEHADQLMQGLTTLSPRRLQALLEGTKSVKVHRLFLWLAERHKYPWLVKLDRARIGMGSGKRVIAKDGKLDPTYQITVPKEM